MISTGVLGLGMVLYCIYRDEDYGLRRSVVVRVANRCVWRWKLSRGCPVDSERMRRLVLLIYFQCPMRVVLWSL
jgi:hypothetical protein